MFGTKKKPLLSIPHHKLVSVYRTALRQGFSVDQVSSSIDRHVERLSASAAVEGMHDTQRVEKIVKSVPLMVRVGAVLVPFVLIGAGMYLLGSAVLPILAYYTGPSDTTEQAVLHAPIPQKDVLDVTPLVVASSPASSAGQLAVIRGPRIIDVELDYTNLANWFQDAQLPTIEGQTSGSDEVYTIDIPKVKVFNATVAVGGTDLNKGLIAYPGTALPGQKGAPVIFGHSVLRQFYNPSEKNPRRYTSIFSYIMTLKPGDEIFVTHKEVKYTYVVREKTEVKPEDVHILTQRYDVQQLKLVTCTPEGTYLRRGVVTAELVQSEVK